MGRIVGVEIEGYRSICDPIYLRLPENQPLVLLGENNAGKSNIVNAIDLILGDRWPGNHAPEDHEFYGRSLAALETGFRIRANLSGVVNGANKPVDYIELHCDESTTLQYPLDDDSMRFVNGAIRDQCWCFTVGADRRLEYQMSYASKWTLLSKLMQRFHKVLLSDPDRAEQLRSHFDELRGMFEGVPEFAEFSGRLQAEVANLSQNLRYGLEVDFAAYDPFELLPCPADQPSVRRRGAILR